MRDLRGIIPVSQSQLFTKWTVNFEQKYEIIFCEPSVVSGYDVTFCCVQTAFPTLFLISFHLCFCFLMYIAHTCSCYLRLMGYVAGQLRMPISCQCRSSLFLNVLVDGASTTSCGSLFLSLTIRKLKNFCLTVVRHLGLNSFNECPLSPLVSSASSKNLL